MVPASFTSNSSPAAARGEGFAFEFAGEELRLLPERALHWPRENALLVADLHLEKASFFARAGQMLPPYDSRETLGRLASALGRTGARRVFLLGDNFHDAKGPARLEPHAAGMLAALTRMTDWVWLAGNHDGARPAEPQSLGGSACGAPAFGAQAFGGTALEELAVGPMVLRHEARPGEGRAEISGHFHPRFEVSVRQKRIRRPCAVLAGGAGGPPRMILPAFGAFTGGMDAADPAILAALQPARRIEALLPAGGQLARFCLWRARAGGHGRPPDGAMSWL